MAKQISSTKDAPAQPAQPTQMANPPAPQENAPDHDEREVVMDEEPGGGRSGSRPAVIKAFVGVPVALAQRLQALCPPDMTVGEALIYLAQTFAPHLPIALRKAPAAGKPILVITGENYDALSEALGSSPSSVEELVFRVDGLRSVKVSGRSMDFSAMDLQMIEGRIVDGTPIADFIPRLVSAARDAFIRGDLEVPEVLL